MLQKGLLRKYNYMIISVLGQTSETKKILDLNHFHNNKKIKKKKKTTTNSKI